MKEMYPSDWKEYKFGDIFDLGGSLSISRANLSDEGICYLHYGDIHKSSDSFIDIDKAYKRIPKYNISINEVDSKFLLKDGDIVFADASEDYEGIAKSLTVINKDNKPFISGLHTIVARDKGGNIDNNYKRYFLRDWEIRKQLMTLATGTSVLGISQPNLKKIKVYLPPKEEQQKIGLILSTWDRAIELKEKLIVQKKEQKKGLMKKLLMVSEKSSGFKKEWVEYRLGDIADIRTGKKDTKDKVENGMYPFFIRSEIVERIDSYSFDGEAILIPGDGNIGKIYHYINGKFDFHQRVYKISNFSDACKGKFIYFYLQQYFYKEAMKYTAKATVDSLRLPMLTNLLIYLPEISEQNYVVSVLEMADKEIELLENELQKIKLQKRGLMQQLLTGKIRV